MDLLLGVYFFVLGTAFGSFALVLADRIHAGRDWVRGRSVCDHCGHTLRAHDLIPLLSWLFQRGKCRYCDKKLSAFYPLVELGLGLAFVTSYWFAPYPLQELFVVLFVLWLLGLVIMAALVVTDLKWFLLLNKLVYPLILVGLVHRIVEFSAYDEQLGTAVAETAGALLVGAGLFWVLNKVSRGKWIGDGDYRLGIAIALFLGDPFVTWMALFFASVLGLVLSLPTILRSRNKARLHIPYGPFLIGGLGVAYLFGTDIINWYSDTFLYL